jgi:hypothetical protein
MIDSISDSLLIIMGENDRIIALMQEVGVYDQMQLAQQSGQDVVLVSGSHIFIWSIDEYIYYFSDNPIEREQVLLEFTVSANEIRTSTRH